MVRARTYGRAGNFYFQAAASIAYARRHGLEYSINDVTSDPYWNPLYLQHLVNPNYISSLSQVMVKEPHFHYAPIPFEESWRDKNIILDGYWQSENHFQEYRKEILEAFNYPWTLISDVCSIHARFGDYLTIVGKHILVNEPYLRDAMQMVINKTGITKFKVFSDNLQYFKEKFGHIYDFEYSTNKGEVDDIVEISCCHSHINSSSTFSWWGAWLGRNEDKVIITQDKWFQEGFNEGQGELNPISIIPDSWIKISS